MASDDNCECPLCMEPFEVDDMSFYPCTCGYQICRFCWHRLKIDGNGLCPACRKAYSENPAHFEPLSEDEIVRIKKERRHKEVQKKQKLTENRRHLSDVRVVQKNLVFVVGLSHRLADAEILKKNEYFGKFGKITKVVINSSPSYAGAQTPSASAYVTYSKADEALKAIQTVNNVQIDNRVLKASLGTTKYCSHFLKGIQCPKADCMYLHDLGEDSASFTKEQMSQGKHLEYESKLIENVLHIPRNLQNISNDQSNQIIINQIHQGLPSALLTHKSNKSNNTHIEADSSQACSSSNTSNTESTSNNYKNTTSNSQNNSNTSNSTVSNTNSNNFDKTDTKSRLNKKSINKSHGSQKSSNNINSETAPSSASTSRNTNTHKSSSGGGQESTVNAKLTDSRHTEEEDDEGGASNEEVISEEEPAQSASSAITNSSNTAQKQTQGASKKTTQKSYLSALGTDTTSESKTQSNNNDEAKTNNATSTNASSSNTTPPVMQKQAINYKEILEKNMPQTSQSSTAASNPETETTIKPVEAISSNQAQQKHATNDKDRDSSGEGSSEESFHNSKKDQKRPPQKAAELSLATEHVVQEEDLGFDPWDEATRSLQDLMKIESNTNQVSKSADSATPASSSSNLTQTNKLHSQLNGNGDVSRQYFNQPNSQQAMFKPDDLQALYKFHLNGMNGVNEGVNALLSDTNNTQQNLNRMLALSSNSNNKFINSDSFNSQFNLEQNYLNKLLLHKQQPGSTSSNANGIASSNGNSNNTTGNNVVTGSKASIAAPPGFNTNASTNAVFNSPISNSSTSSSSSSTASSVNNSTSTTPALNSNANKASQNTQPGLNMNTDSETAPDMFSNSLQDTFRSIFPNANISFGGAKNSSSSNQTKLSNGLANFNSQQNGNKPSSSQNIWPDDPAIVSLNNGFSGQPKDFNAQLADLQERVQSDYLGMYNGNANKQLDQLSYLTSSLNHQQQQQQLQHTNFPNNGMNNLANLLKHKQQQQQQPQPHPQFQSNDQFNNSLINQFQLLYQQHQLVQLQQQQQQANSHLLNGQLNMNSHVSANSQQNSTGNNSSGPSHNSNMLNKVNNGLDNMNINSQSLNNPKSIEDLQTHHQKLLLLNGVGNNFGFNGNSNNLLNSLSQFADLSQFPNQTGNMNMNYGYLMDSNQNIQSNLKSQASNNGQTSGQNLPSMLSMQQQSYMQQLLLQNFNSAQAAQATNSNSE